MKEDIKLMKGNEAIAHAATEPTVTSDTLLRPSRKSWKHSWKKNRGKRPEW